MDSRSGLGGVGIFRTGDVQTLQVTGRGGVPSSAVAVTGNVTVTRATAGGYVTVAPSMTDNVPPPTSTINFLAGENCANGVTVALGSTGTLDFVYWPTAGKTTHIIFDVTGYYG